MRTEKFGIDVSKWQGNIDWKKLSSSTLYGKVEYIGIRATLGKSYTDPMFTQNWRSAKLNGIPRMAYHVVLPSVPARVQMDYFFSVLDFVGGDTGEFPLVLDVELDEKMSVDVIRQAVFGCASIIEEKTKRKPIIYSRAGWVDQYLGAGSPQKWLNDYYWWLALYSSKDVEYQGKIVPPKGVDISKVIIHQTGQKGDGLALGMVSKQVDTNRWLGSDKLFAELSGNTVSTEPVVPGDISGIQNTLQKLSDVFGRLGA